MSDPVRTRVSSGGPWEDLIGYSRATRVGDHVWVSGCTGTTPEGRVPPGALSQARLALDIAEAALAQAGAGLGDVVVARVYVTEIGRWEQIATALRERFGAVCPAMTMVEVSRLIRPEHLVEIEVEAVVGSASPLE